jgi:hypothetical protein
VDFCFRQFRTCDDSDDGGDILEESAAIHKPWRQFAKDARAVVAYVDLESETGIMVHPKSGGCTISTEEQISWFKAKDFDLDEMVRVIHQINGI